MHGERNATRLQGHLDEPVEVRGDDRGDTSRGGQLCDARVHRSEDVGVDALPDTEVFGADLLLHQLRLKVRRQERGLIASCLECRQHDVDRLTSAAVGGHLFTKALEEHRVEVDPARK